MCVTNCGTCSSCLNNLVPLPLGPQGSAGPQGAQGIQGPAGVAGPAGAPGLDGLYGGYSAEWRFRTSTSAPILDTQLRLNNTDWSLADQIIVRHTDINSTNVEQFLNSFVNGGSYGFIRLFKTTDSNVFILGAVTNVVNSGTFSTITFTNIVGNGVSGVDINVDEPVVLSFAGNGTTGLDSEVQDNDFSIVSTSVTSPLVLLKTGTIPATYLSVEDVYIAEGYVNGSTGGILELRLNSTVIKNINFKGNIVARFRVEFHVSSTTSFFIDTRIELINALGQVYYTYSNPGALPIICNNITSSSNTINVLGNAQSPGTLVTTHFVTYKLKK